MKKLFYAVSLPLFLSVIPMIDSVVYGKKFTTCVKVEFSLWKTNVTGEYYFDIRDLVL